MNKVVIVSLSNKETVADFFSSLIYDQGYTHDERLSEVDQVVSLIGALSALRTGSFALVTLYEEDKEIHLHLYRDHFVGAFSESSAVEWYSTAKDQDSRAVTLEDYMEEHPRVHSI